MKKQALIVLLVLVVLTVSVCHSAEYRLFNDNFLTVGNEWHYDMHITIMDNQSVDLSGTADITVTGTANIGIYTNVPVVTFVTSGNDYDSYYYATPDFILELGTDYAGGNLHEIYYNNNPLEIYPIWVDASHNNYQFGNGQLSVTQDDPAMTWTESHDTYVTYLQNETLSVPAGTFECVTIYIYTDWTDSDGFYGYNQETVSIDPHIGVIRNSGYYWVWNDFTQTSSADEYSYELTSTNVSPQPYCKVRSLPMDFNNDCQVDLVDFAMFIQSWLDCELDPIETCWGGTVNQPPIANAGVNQTVTDSDNNGSEQIVLDGSGSTDSDGTIASYVWTESGNEIATGVNPTPTLSVGTHTITLTVTDDDGATGTDTVTVTVEAPGGDTPILVSHWSFDEGGGSIAYDSVGTNDGTIYGAGWTVGEIGGALTFNGTSDYINCGNDSSFAITDEITIAAWIKTNEGFKNYITAKEDSFFLSIGSGVESNTIGFYLMGASPVWVHGTTDLTDNQWHHVAATYDGSVMKVYIDGILEGSNAASGAISTGTTDVLIGSRRKQFYYTGALDDMRIYSTPLDAAEIAALHGG